MIRHGMKPSICIVGPFPPPAGGISIQAEMIANNLRKDGVKVLCVRTNQELPTRLKWLGKVKKVSTIFQVVRYIMKLFCYIKHAEVVHIFSCSYLSFFLYTCPAIIIGRLYRRRVIVNYHGGAAEEFFKKWSIVKCPLKLASIITVPSGFLKHIFCKFELPAVIVSNATDLKKFKYSQPDGNLRKLLVARHLEKEYNVECSIKAFSIVKMNFRDVELVIVGSGTQERCLKELVKMLNLPDVTFTGRVQHSKMAEIYRNSDVFVNSSCVDNMPVSILEAFACGLPIVSTRVGGIPYLVKDRKTGLLVDPNSHDQLAARIMELLENPGLAREIATNARKAVQQYTWDSVRQRLFEVYRQNTSV